MLSKDQLTSVLAAIPSIPIEGNFYRIIARKVRDKNGIEINLDPLSTTGAFLTGGRYNIKGKFGALYLADNPITALLEINSLFNANNSFIAISSPPRTIFTIKCKFISILDLTDNFIQATLNTNWQELTGQWIHPYYTSGHIAPTQELGEAIYEMGKFEAMKVPSSGQSGACNLVVFPDKIDRSGVSYLGYIDDFDGKIITV